MKKENIMAVVVFILPGIVSAQSWLPKSGADTLKSRGEVKMKPEIITFGQMDQRKIYHWANGQLSTPTGRQAGERTSKYVRLYGDSAVIISDPFKNQK